jgi:hypothetical protein
MTLLLLLFLAFAPPQPTTADGVTAQVRVDPPAMWVADRVTYTIDIMCPAGVDIVVEDLDRSKLTLNGLDLLSAETRREEEGKAVRYSFQYLVTTYRVDLTAPGIGPLKVRYFLTRPGQRAQDAAPAGTITIPATTIPFRSLLPDDPSNAQVREGGAIPARWTPYRVMRTVGLALILLSVVPAVLMVARVLRAVQRRRRSERRPSARRTRQAEREALEAIRLADASDPDARREAFTRLESLVRGHLAAAAGPEFSALTAEEIRVMPANGHPAVAWDRVATVLETCEVARFAGVAAHPSVDDWRQALDDAAVIVGAAPDGR